MKDPIGSSPQLGSTAQHQNCYLHRFPRTLRKQERSRDKFPGLSCETLELTDALDFVAADGHWPSREGVHSLTQALSHFLEETCWKYAAISDFYVDVWGPSVVA